MSTSCKPNDTHKASPDASKRRVYQQHFLDLCALVGHGTPAAQVTEGAVAQFARLAEHQRKEDILLSVEPVLLAPL